MPYTKYFWSILWRFTLYLIGAFILQWFTVGPELMMQWWVLALATHLICGYLAVKGAMKPIARDITLSLYYYWKSQGIVNDGGEGRYKDADYEEVA